MKITKQTKINELFQSNPDAAKVLFGAGMGCMGCPMAQQETIEQGCMAHGFSDEEIDELIKRLNKEKKQV